MRPSGPPDGLGRDLDRQEIVDPEENAEVIVKADTERSQFQRKSGHTRKRGAYTLGQVLRLLFSNLVGRRRIDSRTCSISRSDLAGGGRTTRPSRPFDVRTTKRGQTPLHFAFSFC